MINDNNISNWENIKRVVIFHTSDMDSIFATRIAYENIRLKYNITDITLTDITTLYPVPAVAVNPTDDLMVIFIGKVPNMLYVDRTIEMVGPEHVMVLLNNPTYIDYFYNYSFRKEICGLMIAEVTLYELTYLYFVAGARYCDADCFYLILTKNSLTTPVNGKGTEEWEYYRKRLVMSASLLINEAFNTAIQNAEVHPVFDPEDDDLNQLTADYINLYFGMVSVLPSITDSDADFWKELYLSSDNPDEVTNISVYTTLGKSCRHMVYKENIREFRDFALLGVIRKYEQYSVVAINQPFSGVNTFIREEIFNKYHIGVEFCFNGRMHYKIYRLGKDPEHCVPIRKIAEAYGGSGNAYTGTFQTNGELEILPTGKV